MMLLIIFVVSGTAILSQYFNKKLLNVESASKIVNLMYIVCFLISAILFIFFGGNWQFFPLVALVSVINAIALPFYSKAVKISLSQTFVLLPLSDLVPVLLSVIFFGESVLFQMSFGKGILLAVGLILTLFSISLFGSTQDNNSSYRKLLWVVAVYFLIVGIINFTIKIFDERGISTICYLFSWYSGALIGSFVSRAIERDWSLRLKKGLFLNVVALGFFTFVAMLFFYYGLHFIPATIIFPLYSFFYVLGVVLMGLFVFKESAGLGVKGWLAMGFGLVGASLLIMGIYG